MSRPLPSRPAVAGGTASFVSPRAFLFLAAGFLLLVSGMLAFSWRQAAARAELETVVPLPLHPPAAPRATGPPPSDFPLSDPSPSSSP